MGALPPKIEAAPSGHHDGQAMSRECLICKKRFKSVWTGQRICDECKKTEST